MNGAQIALLGRLVQDPPQLSFTANDGAAFVTISVAVNTYRGPATERETDYYRVTLWQGHAQRLVGQCRKGDEIYVAGRFNHRTQTGDDGKQRCSLNVNARDFRHFSSGRELAQVDEANL